MLRKLLKYEILTGGRVILPLYAAVIAASFLMALNIRITNDSGGMTTVWVSILFILCLVGMGVMTFFMILRRFYRNLLGDEGYLMFSLPATTGQHIASKTIVSTLFSAGAAIITGCAFLIIAVVAQPPKEGMRLMGEIFRNIWKVMTSSNALTMILVILLVIAGVVRTILQIYASIAIGHQWSQHRLLGSILAYIVISIAVSLLTNLAVKAGFHLLQGGGGTGSLFISINQIEDLYDLLPSFDVGGLAAALAFNLAQCGIFWFAAWKLLDRRLNLE